MRIDFDRYIAERTEDYSPRPWLFEKIGAWLASPGHSRYCLVISEPGGGKTAVAGQVCNASRGRLGAHDLPIPAGVIDAYHFCFSQDAAWIDPLEFSHSISSQLAASVPGFETALLDVQPEMEHVTAAPKVTTGDVAPGGNVTGVTVNVKLGSAQATFIRVVRNPLVMLYEQGLDRDVVILVDALDEARLTLEKDATIVDLITSLKESLPRVRFLLTSRPEVEIRRMLERQDPHLVIFELGGDAREKSRRDVQRYVSAALLKSAEITSNLGLPLAELEEKLATKADGNFLWVRLALGMLATATQPITAATLDALPPRLEKLYFEFIERVAKKDPARWRTDHAVVLGTLVAAQEEMSVEEIARFSGLDDARVAAVIRDIGQLFDQDPQTGKYALYHRSFSDFLVDRRAAQEYHCDLGAQHRRIVDAWRNAPEAPDYALRNIAAHLFALRGDADMRQHLYALASRTRMEKKRAVLGSDASFANDMARVAEAAAAAGDLVEEIRATSILTALRSRASSVPAKLLALLVRIGELDRARSYLSLPMTAVSRYNVTSEVGRLLLESDPGTAEELLREAIDTAPNEPAASIVRGFWAVARARSGKSDEPLPESQKHENASVVKAAIARGDFATARTFMARLSESLRTSILGEVVFEAAADSDDALQRVMAFVPETTEEVFRYAVYKALQAEQLDVAARIAERAGANAMTNVDAARVARLVGKGDLAAAEAIVAAAPSSYRVQRAFGEALAAQASVADVIAHIGVLPESMYAAVASQLVEREEIDAAFAVAARATEFERIATLQAIAEAGIDTAEPSSVFRAYQESPQALTDLVPQAVALFIAEDALYFGETVLRDERIEAAFATRRELIRATMRQPLISLESAAATAHAAPANQRDDLLVDILVAASELHTDNPMPWIAQEPAALQVLAERAARVLAAKENFDAVRLLASEVPEGGRLLVRAAIVLIERGDEQHAMELLPPLHTLEPSDAIAVEFARHRDVRKALAHRDMLDRDTIAAVAASALTQLGAAETAEMIASFGTEFVPAAFLAKVRRGSVSLALQYVDASAGDAALEELIRLNAWTAAVELAVALPEPDTALAHVLRGASAERQLDRTIHTAKQQSRALTDRVLQSLLAPQEDLMLRAEVVRRVVSARHDYERSVIIDQLRDRRRFDEAMALAAESDDDRLAASIIVARARAGERRTTWPGGIELSSRAVSRAIRELLEKDLDDAAVAYAELLSDSWERADVAVAFAAHGRVQEAIALADRDGGWRRGRTLAAIAGAIAVRDREAALRIVERIPAEHERTKGAAQVIAALASANDVDGALGVLARSRLVPQSTEAMTTVAEALFAAGAIDHARRVVTAALELVDAVDDSWERSATFSTLSRELAGLGQFDEALAMAKAIPPTDPWRALALRNLARQQSEKDPKRGAAMAREALGAARATSRGEVIADEADLLVLIAADRNTKALRDVAHEAATATRSDPTLAPLVLVELSYRTEQLHRPSRWRGWWNRWQARRRARWLLDLASEVAAPLPDEFMRVQAQVAIAAAYANRNRKKLARSLAAAAVRTAESWPACTASIYVSASAGIALHRLGENAAARNLAHKAIELIWATRDQEDVHRVIHRISDLLAALEAPQQELEALVTQVQTSGNEDVARLLLTVAVGAVRSSSERALRLGDLLAHAATEARSDLVYPLCDALLTCAEVAKDATLAGEAWALAQRLQGYDAFNMLTEGARRVARSQVADPRPWIDAALRAIEKRDDPPTVATQRAVVAEALRLHGAAAASAREWATALGESRNATRSAFFGVLHELLDGLKHDPRLPAIAAALSDTEAWWPHRSVWVP